MKDKKISRSKKNTNLLLIAFQFIIISCVILLTQKVIMSSEVTIITTEVAKKQAPIILEKVEPVVEERQVVYDNMTMEELADKLNRSMYGILEGKGITFANYSINYGVDPYMSLAIVLLETGCKWGCSYVSTTCNNIGGQVGYPKCGNGNYRAFATLDEGIKSFFENLAYNYYSYGLTDVYSIHKKYAQAPNWADAVNKYIEEIKAK